MAADAKRATRLRECEPMPESRAFDITPPAIERFAPRINDDWQAFDDFGNKILRIAALIRLIAADLTATRQMLGGKADDAFADLSLVVDVLHEKLGDLYLAFCSLDDIARPTAVPRENAA